MSNSALALVVDKSSGAIQIRSLKLSAATKSPSGYKVGFPDENLIREYLPDGRLVVVKDIYTRKTLKILTYKNNRLEQITSQRSLFGLLKKLIFLQIVIGS
jgi:hypothetical protein